MWAARARVPARTPTPPENERARILPVIRGLAAAGVRVSVDTRHAATMAAALDAGAAIVNDVSALTHDPAAAAAGRRARLPGHPDAHARHARRHDAPGPLRRCRRRGDRRTRHRIDAAERAGIARDAIAIDPGFGFAKHPPHSLALLRGLPELGVLGYPIVVGVSRKGFIGGRQRGAGPALPLPRLDRRRPVRSVPGRRDPAGA